MNEDILNEVSSNVIESMERLYPQSSGYADVQDPFMDNSFAVCWMGWAHKCFMGMLSFSRAEYDNHSF